jgi:hypothetical protein
LIPRRLPWRQRLRLLRGKLRRFYLGLFDRRYVRERRAQRVGECTRCGACCQLVFRCQLLRDNGDVTECRFHHYRPLNCRLFPVDERDLADRDLVAPDTPCGFRFGRRGEQAHTGLTTEAPTEEATSKVANEPKSATTT